MNRNQTLGIIIAILGVLMISTANLTDLFGPAATKGIVSASALLNAILGAVLAAMAGQAGQVRDVLAMPGVEKITVNRDANSTLASIAVDPAVNKIAPTQIDRAAVEATASGG